MDVYKIYKNLRSFFKVFNFFLKLTHKSKTCFNCVREFNFVFFPSSVVVLGYKLSYFFFIFLVLGRDKSRHHFWNYIVFLGFILNETIRLLSKELKWIQYLINWIEPCLFLLLMLADFISFGQILNSTFYSQKIIIIIYVLCKSSLCLSLERWPPPRVTMSRWEGLSPIIKVFRTFLVLFWECNSENTRLPVSTRRRFDVDTTLYGRQQRCYNVEKQRGMLILDWIAIWTKRTLSIAIRIVEKATLVGIRMFFMFLHEREAT